MRLLAGITHAIVEVPSRNDSHKSGVVAEVELCFGPGDDTSICHIQYVRGLTGTPVWRVPHIPVVKDNATQLHPVFRGELMEQICNVAARALDRIKEVFGRPEYGLRYRVADSKAVLMPKEQAA
jgi:hypothetical protein